MATIPAPTVEFQPLPTTREQRGRQIAARGGIRQVGARYVVPAQSANSNVPTYVVDIVEQSCTCPDYELRHAPCKHIEATYFWLAWEGAVNVETGEIKLPKKQQSKQNWPAYNRAQTTERKRVPQFLHALCLGVPYQERDPGKSGRKPIPDPEAIFSLVMKVASGCSGRRFESDMENFVKLGYISRPWDANTVFRAMENGSLTPILTELVEEAAGPAAQVENAAGHIAFDATGFKTPVRRVRDENEVVINSWYDQKHKGEKQQPRRFIHDWVKLHAGTGVLTNIVTAAKVTPGMGKGTGDSPNFPGLINATAKRFTMKEISADMAYLKADNLAVVDGVGAVPFIPFTIKQQRKPEQQMQNPSEHWRKMWAYFDLKKEEFLKHYHRRSNVESTFGALKQKFGGSVRSKLFVAQQNEILAKVLLWNLSCIVHAIEEFGVEAEFSHLVMP